MTLIIQDDLFYKPFVLHCCWISRYTVWCNLGQVNLLCSLTFDFYSMMLWTLQFCHVRLYRTVNMWMIVEFVHTMTISKSAYICLLNLRSVFYQTSSVADMVVDVYLKQMTGSESRMTSLLNCKSSIILWELWMRLHPSHSLSSPLPLSHLILSCPVVLTVTHYSLLDDFLSVPILLFTSVRVEHTGGWGLAVLHGLVCQSRVLFTFSTIEFEPEFNCFYATLLFSSTVRL